MLTNIKNPEQIEISEKMLKYLPGRLERQTVSHAAAGEIPTNPIKPLGKPIIPPGENLIKPPCKHYQSR